MKISDRDKILILSVIFLAIVLLPIFLFIRPRINDIKGLESELEGLNKRYEDLKKLDDKRPLYEAEITRLNEEREQMITGFAEGVLQENTIMFLYDIETTYPMVMTKETFETIEETPVTSGKVENGEVVGDLTALKFTTTVEYRADYAQIKKLLDYIFTYNTKMSISAIGIEFDPDTAQFEGYFTLNEYAFVGHGRSIESVTLPSLNRGQNENPFKRVMPLPRNEDLREEKENENNEE